MDLHFFGDLGSSFAVVVAGQWPQVAGSDLSIFQKFYKWRLKSHQTPLPGLRFGSFDFKMLFRDVNLAPVQGADFRSSQPGKELNCDKRKEL
jgi:hypothetical protein